MYKEKLKNYIDKSDSIQFIIKNPETNEMLSIHFIKEGDEYIYTEDKCEEVEKGKYENTGDDTVRINVDEIPDDVLKMFVERWEHMIIETIYNM